MNTLPNEIFLETSPQLEIGEKPQTTLTQLPQLPLKILDTFRLKENESDLKCAYPNHNQPILLVVLDPKLNSSQRLLCSLCMQTFSTNYKTIGLQMIYKIIEENYQEKRKTIEVLINDNIQQLDQLKNNIIQLRSIINQQFDQMMDIANNWINHFNILMEGSFYQELDLLIKNQQKVDQDQIQEQINYLNNQWIGKMNKQLEQFKSFKQYSECEKILNNFQSRHNSKQEQKQQENRSNNNNQGD